jgi:hypothetical protein
MAARVSRSRLPLSSRGRGNAAHGTPPVDPLGEVRRICDVRPSLATAERNYISASSPMKVFA